jgi:2-methylcitrate dehydratase PrpD
MNEVTTKVAAAMEQAAIAGLCREGQLEIGAQTARALRPNLGSAELLALATEIYEETVTSPVNTEDFVKPEQQTEKNMSKKATSEQNSTTGQSVENLTRKLAAYSSGLRFEDIPEEVRMVVRHCLLDWLGVTLAGSREDAARIVREEALEQGGTPQATLIGSGQRTSVGQAALVNGTASHALDYDDVHFAFLGHPTVTVVPAILAVAERDGHDGRAFLTAFVAGVEVGSRIGEYVTEAHYARGHHATGTLGTFSAAAGSARMLNLDAETSAIALGIAATQAAALKSMFGTMCKPLHAGKAAANGQYAALIARRGFTSRSDAIECSQGFADTQSPVLDATRVLEGLADRFHTRDVLFKFHAACYGTHSSIEALRRLRNAHDIDSARVHKIEIRVPTRNLRVCNIQEPTTGLEAKFSLRLVSAMALAGVSTSDIAGYSDTLCTDRELVRLRDCIQIVGDDALARGTSEVIVSMADGVVFREFDDVSIPNRDLDEQGRRLEEKFVTLASPVIGDNKAHALVDLVRELEQLESMDALVQRCR